MRALPQSMRWASRSPAMMLPGWTSPVQQRDVKPAEDRRRFRGVRGAAEQANCPPDQGSGVPVAAALDQRRGPALAQPMPAGVIHDRDTRQVRPAGPEARVQAAEGVE